MQADTEARYAVAHRLRVKNRVAKFRIWRRCDDVRTASAFAAEMNCGRRKQRWFVVERDSVKGWKIVGRVAG